MDTEVTPHAQPAALAVGRLKAVPLGDLHPAPWNARKFFDELALKDLAKDLRLNGQAQPILVRPRSEGGYEVVAGERRYRAAKLAELPRIDVVVREMDDLEARRQSITENLNREDLNPYEETVGILDLLSLELSGARKWMGLLEEHGSSRDATAWVVRHCAKSHPEVHPKALLALGMEARELEDVISAIFGERAGMNVRSFVNNRLPLLRLPEDVREALEQGWLEYSKANVIAGVEDKEKRQELLYRTVNEQLTLQTVLDLASAYKNPDADEGFLEGLAVERQSINRYWRYAPNLNANEQRKLERLLRETRELLQKASEKKK